VHLLVVTQYFWPETFRVNDLVEGFIARGHTVTVLTGRPNYPEGRLFDAYRTDPSAFDSYHGARVLRVPLRPRGQGKVRLLLNYWSFVFWATLLGPWLLRGARYDAIFMFESSPITSALPAVFLRWWYRVPMVMWVLDLWPETLSAVGIVRSPFLLGLVGRLVSFIYRRCDLVLAQSRAFFGNIEHWSGDTTRVRYFPGWAEPIFMGDPAAVVPAPETGPYSGTFNVMFAGNIGEAQDFPAIIDACDRLRHRDDIRFLIVGDGRAAADARAAVDDRGLGERMIFLGKHPLERMPSFFRAAGALLVSLKSEPIFSLTIPGKVQPYLATGIPLIGMLDGEGARVIDEAGAGFTCAAGDGEALAREVSRMADLDQSERDRIGLRGREYGRREFDRDMLFARLEGWLEDLIAGRPPCG
jgi:glycosyltransferase involved in cell wall biosynthesis